VATTAVSVFQGHTASMVETFLYASGLLIAIVLAVRYLRGIEDVAAGHQAPMATPDALPRMHGLC
jgi:hypothetical protein